MARSIGRSAASRLFLWLAGAALVLALGTAGLLVLEAQRAARAEAERATQAVAATLAGLPEVRSALAAGDGEAATRTLQPIAREVMSSAGVDFVTVMDTAGIRITHRDPAQIGQHYIGTIPPSPQTITRNGKPSVVVVSAEEWQRKTARKGTLAEFLLDSPLRGADLDLERKQDEPRDLPL